MVHFFATIIGTIYYDHLQLVLIDRSRSEIIGLLNRTVVVFSIVCCLEAIYGVMQYFGLDFFHPGGYHSYESNVIGTFGSANSMGCYLAALMPFLFYSFRYHKNKIIKGAVGFSIFISVAALVLTLSRGAWVALMGGLFFLAYPALTRFFKKKVRKGYVRVGIIICLLLMAILFAVGAFFLNTDSALGRIFIWKVSGLMVADHPILGVGYGNYGYQYLNYQMKFYDNPANAVYYDKACNIKLAHSEFVHITAETGIIGLILFCSLIVLFFKKALDVLKKVPNAKKDDLILRTIIASFIIIVLHSLVDSVLHTLPISIMFYFVIAIISAISKKQSESDRIISRNIRFSKKMHAVILSLGLILLLFNIYRVIWKGIGFVYWKNGQFAVLNHKWNEGVIEYEKAIHYLPDNGELQFHLGAAYAYIGQTRLAVTLLEESLTGFNDKNIYIALSKAYQDSVPKLREKPKSA